MTNARATQPSTLINVLLKDNSYPILVGDKVAYDLHRVPENILGRSVDSVAVVLQESVGAAIPDLIDYVVKNLPTDFFYIPEGEESKTMKMVESLCCGFAEKGITRNDLIIGLGGGVTTDIAGLAASLYHRGMDVVHVPTTLLGQIDAAVGGKTGVNLPQGKNMVGTFWQPRAVLCDTSVLNTLPAEEMRSGFGEMAKYHFLGANGIYQPSIPLTERELAPMIVECIRIKSAMVSRDETESNRKEGRFLLNYGHTLAHALEAASEYSIKHGEAVGVGIHFAGLLARRLGLIDDEKMEEHLNVLSYFGLEVAIPAKFNQDDLIRFMRSDKKSVNGISFVLINRDELELVDGISEDIVKEVLRVVSMQ